MQRWVIVLTAALIVAAWLTGGSTTMSEPQQATLMVYDVQTNGMVMTASWMLSDAEWRKRLRPESYRVLRAQGTERPFSCGFLEDKGDGTYVCAGCGLDLFSSKHKFDSGTGWPSFFQPVHENNIGTSTDYDIGYARTEVHCKRCQGHLGHVFPDGPRPTGLRYCINGVSLDFRSDK